MVPFERALVTSYSPSNMFHSNFAYIFTRFRDIASSVLQHTTFSHSQIFPNCPGSRWMAFNMNKASEGVGLIIRQSVQLVSTISNLCGPDPSTVSTDRRTDDMQS